MEMIGQLHDSVALLPDKTDPDTCYRRGWVGLIFSVDALYRGKICDCAGACWSVHSEDTALIELKKL